jgi:hypothetical protein
LFSTGKIAQAGFSHKLYELESSGSASGQISICRGDKIKKPLEGFYNPPEALTGILRIQSNWEILMHFKYVKSADLFRNMNTIIEG